jgi:hypothetical protein
MNRPARPFMHFQSRRPFHSRWQIGTGSDGDEGLAELHALNRRYPRLDVFAHLSHCSEEFKAHIREGLARMAAKSADSSNGPSMGDVSHDESTRSSPKTPQPQPLSRTPVGQSGTNLAEQFKALEAQMPTVTGERGDTRVQSGREAESRAGGQESPAAGVSKLRLPQTVRRPPHEEEQAGEAGPGHYIPPRAAEYGTGAPVAGVGMLNALRERMRTIQAQAAVSPTEPSQNGGLSSSFESGRGGGSPIPVASTSPGGTVTVADIQERLRRLKGGEQG